MISTTPTQEQIDKLVAEELSPDVVRIKLTFTDDWNNELAFLFRVILSDEAAKRKDMNERTEQIAATVRNRLGLESLHPYPYFRWRSQSEQAETREKSWE
jgi:hypothetical protein